MKKFIFLICSLTLAISCNATTVYGQTGNGSLPEYIPLEKFEGINQTGSAQSLQETLNFAFKILFSVGGLIAVLTLIIGGIVYMVSDVVNKKSQALNRIRAALWGLGLLAISWLILYTINPDLLKFNFNANRMSTSPPTQTQTANGSGTGNMVRVEYDCKKTGLSSEDSAFQSCNTACENRGGTLSGIRNGEDSSGIFTLYRCVRR